MSLDFTEALGRDRISAVASIVDSDSPAPLRTLAKLEKYSGKIPKMKEKFRMNEDQLRALKTLQATNFVGGANTSAALVKFLTKHVLEASVAGDKRVDLMMLQGVSTLTIDVSTTGNPDGAATGTLDLLPTLGATQKQGVPVVWTDATNAKPFDDIYNYVFINRNNRGRQFGAIMMSANLFQTFKATAQVKSYIQTLFNVGKVNVGYSVTLDTVNLYLETNQLPPIVIVNYTSMIEVDGKPTYVQGFNNNNVAFVPSGKLGTLKNAIPLERIEPILNKNYADYGATLVSKWGTDDPMVEWTGMEMIAFPALNVDGIFLLKTDTVQTPFV